MTGALLAVLVMLVWLYLLVTRARLSGESHFDRLESPPPPEAWPPVSIVIPARNEAEILPFTLPSALSFYYPQGEVILVDDCSTDGTAETAEHIARSAGREHLRVVRGVEPPPGWRGKPWALDQGVRAASGDWLLLSDADMVYEPELLRRLVRFALARGYRAVSLMARLRAESFWDRLLIPPFVFFFHLLYPFDRVRDSRSRVAAAAGGCLLVERQALESAGGLAAVAGAWIDDLALAAALKRSGASLYLGASADARSFRRYGSLASIWQMVARSAFTQLRFSWGLVLASLLGLGALFALPVAGVVSASGVPAAALTGAASALSLGFMMAAYAPILRLYNLPVLWGFTLPLAALFYAAMTVSSAATHTFRHGPQWKGRRAAAPKPRRHAGVGGRGSGAGAKTLSD